MHFTNRQIFLNHLAQTSPEPLMVEIASANGCNIFDVNGKKYLDLISGISVCNLGHGNKAITEAAVQQLNQFSHIMVYGEMVLSPQTKLAELLASILPSNLNCSYFVNSGSEATEGAIKLARKFTGRPGIIAMQKAYHGSSTGALSLMGDTYYSAAYRPLLPGITFIEQNVPLDSNYYNPNIAAVFVEPVMGEKGAVPCTQEFLKSVRNFCTRNGSLLVLDEIQTGMGRTGAMFAFEKYGIVPDVLLLGKAFGGGMPMGAFVSSAEIMQSFTKNPVLGHITTFGGHPVACAAAFAAITETKKLINEEDIAAKGNLFKSLLQKGGLPNISGEGLLLAIDMEDASLCKKVILQCLNDGLFTDWFLFAPQKLRIAPPLTITDAEIEFACATILKAYGEAKL